MPYQKLKTLDVHNKVVLLRADLNVPAKDGQVTDFTRIDRLKETVAYLKDKGAKIVFLSHFGRPKGEPKPEYSLSFLPSVLEERLDVKVSFAEDCIDLFVILFVKCVILRKRSFNLGIFTVLKIRPGPGVTRARIIENIFNNRN